MKGWIYESLISTLGVVRRRLVAEGFAESVDLLDQLQASIDRESTEEGEC